ncbi:MAG: nucleotidyltransferase domain-containing protein [Candidatus Eisenbacteria sp.]|nr:nucleotidyltransferase domain-containing protein [Candidatus Eisenbacteria bacterium]
MDRDLISTRLEIDIETLRTFCAKWKIVELALFGSVLAEDFRPDSDIDALVTFGAGAHGTLWDFIHMREEFEQLVGRRVDLIERAVLKQSRNYIRRSAILGSAKVIYAA